MTKIPLVLLLLSSCSSINYGDLPGIVSDSIFGVDIEVTDELYDSQPYSFAKMNIGKSIVAITVLSQIKDDTYLWLTADGERIHTKNGKVVKTEGLKYDVEVLDPFNLGYISFKDIPSSSDRITEILLQLDNPHAIIQQSLFYNQIGIDESYFNSMLYKEGFSSGKLAWKEENSYWVDRAGRVIKTEQYIHPRLPKVVIEFFYK